MYEGLEAREPSFEFKEIVYETLGVMALANDEDIAFAAQVDVDFYVLVDVLYEHNVILSNRQLSKCSRYMTTYLERIIYPAKLEWKLERPFVLAEQLEIPFERKFFSRTANDASYPSGHAFGSRFLAHCFLDEFSQAENEELRTALFQLTNRIAMSRVQIGVHSLQDIREGIRLADITYEKFPIT